jgi:protein TonB
MFADSLLETSWSQRGRRGLTTLTSFGLQAVVMGALLAIPLLTTVGSPLARTVSTPISLGRRDPGPPPTNPGRFHSSSVEIIPVPGRIIAPGRIPATIVRGDDSSQTGPTITDVFGSNGGPYTGHGIGMNLPFSGTQPVIPAKPNATITREFKTSKMLQGMLIHRVEPVYPQLARTARIQGSVVLEAVISKEGTMKDLRLISGHPLLVQSALQAVSQWQYKPYILNGDAIEVETQITVNFMLNN